MVRTKIVDDPPSHHEIKNSKPQAHKNLFKKVMISELHPLESLSFMNLIPDAHHHILQFCDVSALRALGCCSKKTCEMTREDKVWEERLKQLFERGYDKALDEYMQPLQLSVWPLRSTSLRAWYHSWVLAFWDLASSEYRDDESDIREYMIEYFYEEGLEINNPLLHSSIFKIFFVESLDEISDEDRKKPKHMWLFEDAPLWAYYNHAKSAFQEGKAELDDMEEDFCKKKRKLSRNTHRT